MNMLTRSALVLSIIITIPMAGSLAQAQTNEVTIAGDEAFAFANGAIQKTTPRDGIVNVITGDNQSSGNRMLLGKGDTLYLKLKNPTDVAIGDLFTVYTRVRKVFHPMTNEYLGFVVFRQAIVKVTATDHALTTVKAVKSFGHIAPGDPVMRFTPPSTTHAQVDLVDTAELSGMIVDIQADKMMTMVSRTNAAYLDRGMADGLKIGDLLDIQRRSPGLPPRNVGQLKVVAIEERTATAQIVKATTRVFRGDRVKLVGYSEPVVQPVEIAPASTASPIPTKADQAPDVSADLLADQLKTAETSGESRINLGDLAQFLRYESGEAAIRPEGYKVLDQLIEQLVTNGDTRLIRVEGHTDNVEIGPSLKARYPSNIDLSKARAGSVARYLIEKGGLDSARLSSVGYGASRPTTTNANEEGRSKNRRVEIVLYNPQAEPQAPASDEDNPTQQDASRPSEPNPTGTTSRLPARDNSSSISDSENSSAISPSSNTSPQQSEEEDTASTSNTTDGNIVISSDDQQDAQGTVGDNPTITNETNTSQSMDTPIHSGDNQSEASSSMDSAGL
ncbi:MAG: OmpA family protein [Nitrospira sp.]|nr:OmpA family protein [Nitrospira sp.]